jgi:hypothetical protein
MADKSEEHHRAKQFWRVGCESCYAQVKESLIKSSEALRGYATDARQGFDLTGSLIANFLKVSDLLWQVTALQKVEGVFGKSETCRASERQSRKAREPTCPC